MELITDKYTAFEALKKSVTGQVLKNFVPQLRDEFDIMMEAVSIHGYALQYASERMSNNKDIVKKAVEKHQLAFRYAGSKIMNNEKFILENLQTNLTSSEIFKYCSPTLQKDKDFAKKFVEINAFGLKYFPAEFKSDREIAMLALESNEYSFQYIKKELRDNLEITQRALANHHNFKFIAKKYKNDESMALLAIEDLSPSEEFSDFSYISPTLKNNKEFFKKTISKKPLLFAHASDTIKQDCELVKFFLDQMKITVDHPYTNHKELLAPIIKKNSYYFKFASHDILNDRHIILDALKKDSSNIRYASDEIKNMLGTNKAQYVEILEKIISIEDLAEKLDGKLFKDDKAPRTKVKI